MRVLALNSGSSSLKLAVYDASPEREELRWDGEVAPLGAASRLVLAGADGDTVLERSVAAADARAATGVALDALAEVGEDGVDAIGHRVVHGGPEHTAPARIDAPLLDGLRGLVPFAPLHLPGEIGVVREVERRHPALPQVACFDTAFHRRMPEIAQRYPLPRELWDRGLRRYGFHGLSYEYVLEELGERAPGRAVIAHLGNGASLAAVRDGQPIDTTMGFTPAGGIIMGTRSGDLDPGVLVYLLRHESRSADELEELVNERAGLLGLSGTTSDMKSLLERRDEDPAAALAVAMFCARVRSAIGALAATLGGLDTLVFTGGIGERGAAVRAEVAQGLEHLGVHIDTARNARSDAVIGEVSGGVTVRVVHTHEEQMIARHTRRVLEASA